MDIKGSMQKRSVRIPKIYKMINFDDSTNENKIEHNLRWPHIQIIHTEYLL